MSWINGYSYLIGLIAVDITLAWTSAEFIFYMANIMNFTQITHQGAYVGLYIGLIILGSLYTTLGVKFSAYLNKFMVIWAAIGTIIVVCVCPAMAPTHPSAKWVFTEFKNNTGYDNNGLVFLLGLLQAGWAMIGYECGAQIVEGTKRADVTAPRGIIICVLSAIFQGFILIISVLFSIQDVEELLNSDMPIATYFIRATNTPLAVFFLVILLVTSLGSLCNSLLASAQILWAMARDGCVPFSKHLYKLSEKNRIPYNALFWQAVICVIIILPVSCDQILYPKKKIIITNVFFFFAF
jgi:amino acid transporter